MPPDVTAWEGAIVYTALQPKRHNLNLSRGDWETQTEGYSVKELADVLQKRHETQGRLFHWKETNGQESEIQAVALDWVVLEGRNAIQVITGTLDKTGTWTED